MLRVQQVIPHKFRQLLGDRRVIPLISRQDLGDLPEIRLALGDLPLLDHGHRDIQSDSSLGLKLPKFDHGVQRAAELGPGEVHIAP